MDFIPFGNRIVVKMDEVVQQGQIYVPQNALSWVWATVVGVGTGTFSLDGKVLACESRVGDRVRCYKGSGVEIELDEMSDPIYSESAHENLGTRYKVKYKVKYVVLSEVEILGRMKREGENKVDCFGEDLGEITPVCSACGFSLEIAGMPGGTHWFCPKCKVAVNL